MGRNKEQESPEVKVGKMHVFYITRIGMVYMSKRQQAHRDENVRPRPPLVFNKQRGNLHTTDQAAAGPKTSYRGTAKELPHMSPSYGTS